MRLTGDKANKIFGTRFLPIISNDDPMAGKILAYAHREKVWKGEDIHYTTDGTIAKMQSGQFGVCFMKIIISNVVTVPTLNTYLLPSV